MITINIRRPNTVEEAQKVYNYVRCRSNISVSAFYADMVDKLLKDYDIIYSPSYKFYFWFIEEDEAREFFEYFKDMGAEIVDDNKPKVSEWHKPLKPLSDEEWEAWLKT